MTSQTRTHPAIPDHDVLRKIGGGAYGEVWLARGVTGALRAVKVVWRQDFEDERSFEREFEGILKFEPMSRDHPALVNILHVGRSPDTVSFYYYVMEIGDDMTSGQDINPIEYEPRTLRADSQQGAGLQWNTDECVDVGLRLAEALDHLHERGLAHRDVKPSNVIFVNGRAKLADIGLVAARGQRTFVGTEGFVPPEGPGSAQADIYSLGKVLYEIATGKDRLSFPELPDQITTGSDRKRWLELNKIICEICDPRLSKRKISTAAELASALRRLQRGKRRRRSGLAVWTTTLLLTAFSCWAGWEVVKDSEWFLRLQPAIEASAKHTGIMRIASAPEGAEVFDSQGTLIGLSQTGAIVAHVGDVYSFTLKKDGYRPAKLEGIVPPSVLKEPLLLFSALEVFSPPSPGNTWLDHFGNTYQAVGQDHESVSYVTKSMWQQYVTAANLSPDTVEFVTLHVDGKTPTVVLASVAEADAFCAWFRNGGYKAGFLTDDHDVMPLIEPIVDPKILTPRALENHLSPFKIIVRQIAFGEVEITTDPTGVEVYLSEQLDPGNRVSKGTTSDSLVINKVKPGDWQLYLVHEGYKPLTIDLHIAEGEKLSRHVTLEKSLGVVFGKTWENSIQMKFVPIGQELMASVWETRVRDYRTFCKESGYPFPRSPGFSQKGENPIVNVSRDDADAFCVWLTQREQKDERIAQTHVYRLPTDLEWSEMAGLQDEEGINPGLRDFHKKAVYPWGQEWPPPPNSGNFADSSFSQTPGLSEESSISGYRDGFAQTSPVGSFPPSPNGLFDLGGNIQEWVSDPLSSGHILGVLRGGGWSSHQPESLLLGSRNVMLPSYRDAIYGFRVILAKIPPKSEPTSP
jgi:eukaryotic-like serine/threonine-protein kinase